jgi:hypothetical protein
MVCCPIDKTTLKDVTAMALKAKKQARYDMRAIPEANDVADC